MIFAQNMCVCVCVNVCACVCLCVGSGARKLQIFVLDIKNASACESNLRHRRCLHLDEFGAIWIHLSGNPISLIAVHELNNIR